MKNVISIDAGQGPLDDEYYYRLTSINTIFFTKSCFYSPITFHFILLSIWWLIMYSAWWDT
ncbi:hypothetical protein DICPUDRAFT_155764 [Dictyostelium purpureum]|uniref:Uncharacterized protein n=1 Tax=Dictyostelium purpureum TaxID=5786 RepID=F0ZUU0_DICPU|nr:uncharacterized protein DICPUDRAFT_155764 [Dictyostelium purpureum]EGC32299.1 hypothetical protein DICPUDRAFT_155764 [Dictyostelium purpureum]|eukprot:XP_003291177.1 hypothetical protein DICPUDRAFT_155764 [Dictyostelium purpureum]